MIREQKLFKYLFQKLRQNQKEQPNLIAWRESKENYTKARENLVHEKTSPVEDKPTFDRTNIKKIVFPNFNFSQHIKSLTIVV